MARELNSREAVQRRGEQISRKVNRIWRCFPLPVPLRGEGRGRPLWPAEGEGQRLAQIHFLATPEPVVATTEQAAAPHPNPLPVRGRGEGMAACPIAAVAALRCISQISCDAHSAVVRAISHTHACPKLI